MSQLKKPIRIAIYSGFLKKFEAKNSLRVMFEFWRF